MATHGGLDPSFNVERLGEILTSDVAAMPGIQDRLATMSGARKTYNSSKERQQSTSTTNGDDAVVTSRKTRKAMDFKNLNRLLEEEDRQVDHLRSVLKSTGERLAAATEQSNAVERRLRQVQQREGTISAARKRAESEAARAAAEARAYRLHLELANRENAKAQEAVNTLLAERQEAEEAAARARTKARRLQEKLVWERARQLGRNEGLEEGLHKGYDEGLDQGRQEGHGEGYEEARARAFRVFEQALKDGAILENGDFDLDAAIKVERSKMLALPPPRSQAPSRRSSFRAGTRQTPHRDRARSVASSRRVGVDGAYSESKDPLPPNIQVTVTGPPNGSQPRSFRSPSPHSQMEPFPDGYVPTMDASGRIGLPAPFEINPSPSLRPSPLPSNASLPGSSYDPPHTPRSSRRPSVTAADGVYREEAVRLRREKEEAEHETARLTEELLRERELREKEEVERERERAAEQRLQQERERDRQAELEREAKLARELEVERELRELEERERLERERLERERLERERLEKERLEQERLEKERFEEERLEEERLERERLEKERVEKERLEQERLEKERLEKERLEQERLEKVEKERLEKERLEKERLEKERLEKERLEKERLEKERLDKERVERERVEMEHLEKERTERDRIEQERVEQERLEKEQERERERRREQERIEKGREEARRSISRDTARDELDEDGESEDEDEVTTDEPVNLPYPTGPHRHRTVPSRRRNAKSRSVASHKTGQTYKTAGAASTPLSSFSVLVPESDMEDRRRHIASENEKTLQAVRRREREELDAANRTSMDPHADPHSRAPFNGGILPVIREQPSTSELNGNSGREPNTPRQSQPQAPRTPHPANPILPIRLDRGPPDHIANGIGMPTPGSTHHNLPKSPSSFSRVQNLADDSYDSEQNPQAKGQRIGQSQRGKDHEKYSNPWPQSTTPGPLANGMPQTNDPWSNSRPANPNHGPGFPIGPNQPGGSPALPPLPQIPSSPRQVPYAPINMTPGLRSAYDRVANLQASNGPFEPIVPGSPATSVREGKPVDIPTIHVERPSRESSESSQMNPEGHLLTPEAVKHPVELPQQPSQPVPQPGRPRPILKQTKPSNARKTQDGPPPTYNGQPVPSLSNAPHSVGADHPSSHPRTGTRSSAPPSPHQRTHSPHPASPEAVGIIPDIPDAPNQGDNGVPGSPLSSVANPVTADMLPEPAVTKRMARPGAYHPPEPGDRSRPQGSPFRTIRNSWTTPGPTIEPDLPTTSPSQIPSIQVQPASSRSPFITQVPIGQTTPGIHSSGPFAQVTDQNIHHYATNGVNPQTVPTPEQRMARPLGSRIEDISEPVFTTESPRPPLNPSTPRMSRPIGSTPLWVPEVTVGATPHPGMLPPMTPKMARPLASRHEDFGGPTDANASPVIPPQTPGRMLRPGMRPPSPNSALNRFGGPPPVVDLVVRGGYGYPNASRTGPAFGTPALPSMTPKQDHGQIGQGDFSNGFSGGFGGRGGGMVRPGNFARRVADDSVVGGPGRGTGPRPLVNYPNASRTGPAFHTPGLPPTTPRHIPQPITHNRNGIGNGFSGPRTRKKKHDPESSPSPVIPNISLAGPSPSSQPMPPGAHPSPAPLVQPAFAPIQMVFEPSPKPTTRPLSRATSIKSAKTMPRKASVKTVSDEGSETGLPGMFDNGW